MRAGRVGDAIAAIRRFWAGESGFLRPEPSPPIIVGGFGPRMAAIAGRHADGFNTQALHPELGELVRLARTEHEAAGRDASGFIARQMLDRVGVHRLILLVAPPFDAGEIRAAGHLLGAR